MRNKIKSGLVLVALTASMPNSAMSQATGEAPELAALVAAKTLPPVEERASLQPEVINYGELGTYGGTIRFGMRGVSDEGTLRQAVGTNGLVRWHHNLSDLVPNVIREYTVSEDAREFTFNMREGMKWSDGHDFTSEDIAFSINDLLLNPDWEEISTRYKSGGKPLSLEIVDKYTFIIRFEHPNGGFLGQMAREEGARLNHYSKHYCSQFHPSYNDNIDTVVAEAGLESWQELMYQKCGDVRDEVRWINPERPALDPWILTSPLRGGTTSVLFERNPYFWQVDEAGNQLPYIGKMEATIYQDAEAMLIAAIAGDFDFQYRRIDAPGNRPVLAENREAGDYQLYEVTAAGGSYNWIQPNLNHKDPVVNALFNQRDFRVALSIGTDRQEVIDTALLGVGIPWQTGPFKDSPLHHERISTQYLDYDPDRANELLDSLGLKDRDENGIRLMSDGRPAKFLIDIRNGHPHIIDMMTIVKPQWEEVLGIQIDLNVVDRSVHRQRSRQGDHDMTADSGNATWLPGQLPSALLPIDSSSRHAPLWTAWYQTNGQDGIKPPEHVMERYRIWETVYATADPAEQIRRYHQLADIAADQFEAFGIAQNASTYGVRKNGLMNILEGMKSTGQFPSPANVFMPQAWYWKK
ncbi:peptide ABC transporter substrate-binding protein [Amylibacter marinus]|uniref:Peptide ABC transporter substrate-binding protein n=1 Tax=Amylibacter marinus TaxID=1475483 RepID=A0ABQ5VVA2_9RHOB|nr:ABC transporter substrate-binding protein [Amylibacter marinus]GLQ35074.1 peptide ABC transporter substrate-binding protein [Amylibacter marinus]